MGKELIITEKPSAAKRIAAALSDDKPKMRRRGQASIFDIKHNGNAITIVSAVGHLYTVAEDKKSFNYPSYEIGWKPSAEVSKESQYTKVYADTIRDESKKADIFTVATDYDVEGEVIGLNTVRFLCKQKDANRMKFSTLTKPDLVEAYDNKSKSIDWGQAKAGETRHFLDWLYGINVSRALTLAVRKQNAYKVLSSGRVQGPALRLLVEREKEIKAFKSEPFWQLQLLGLLEKADIEAWHEKDKFWKEDEADSVLKNAKGHDGKISDLNKNKIKQAPPYPFDLTTLQTEGYRVFRYTPKMTLEIAQTLYSHGYISYPRTSSQQLSPKIGFRNILTQLSKQPLYDKLAKFLLNKDKLFPNNGKKTDPAHPAIYPTGIIPKKLEGPKRKVYDLIVKRFLATFGDWAERESVELKIDVNSEIFIAKGIRTTIKGWHEQYAPYVRLKEEELPTCNIGDTIKVKEINKLDKETQPPKRYTQASILKELEKRNLGTKATRAQILQNLIDRNYVSGKSLEVSELGIKTIELLEEYSPKIIEEELTRHFEEEMEKISEGKAMPEKVLDEAKNELTSILKDFKKNENEIGKKLLVAYREGNGGIKPGKDPKTGKEVSVKKGRYGPYVQLGENGDATFASIPRERRLDEITLEEALKLLELPRHIGKTKEGVDMEVNNGRYGPYVKYGKKFVSLGEKDPYTITNAEAQKLIEDSIKAKKKSIIHDYGDYKVINGRYGPYVTDGKKNVKAPKGKKPEELTLEDCKNLFKAS